MSILYCDGKRFRKAFLAGASWLAENKETLDQLNVFPVPDGDTGTNMALTLFSAVDELRDMRKALDYIEREIKWLEQQQIEWIENNK